MIVVVGGTHAPAIYFPVVDNKIELQLKVAALKGRQLVITRPV